MALFLGSSLCSYEFKKNLNPNAGFNPNAGLGAKNPTLQFWQNGNSLHLT